MNTSSANTIFLMLIILLGCTSISKRKEAFLQGFDTITLPNSKFTLKAKLEADQFFPYRPNLDGININLESNHIKLVKPTKSGFVSFTHPSLELGTHTIKLSTTMSKQYTETSSNVTVAVLKKYQKIMIIDIDHTIANTDYLEFLKGNSSNIKPLKNAKNIILKLKKEYYPVYLTARDDSFINKTKRWLSYWQFPKGPIFFKDVTTSESRKEYKSRIVASIKKNFPNILIGVGDKVHDIRAYRENGLRAYYIGAYSSFLPKETIIVQSWDELYLHLTKNSIGKLNRDPSIY